MLGELRLGDRARAKGKRGDGGRVGRKTRRAAGVPLEFNFHAPVLSRFEDVVTPCVYRANKTVGSAAVFNDGTR